MSATKGRAHGHTLPVLHPFSFRRWRRDVAKLSQQEASDKLGLGIATVRSWESMKRPITAPGLVAWAVQAINYGLTPADLTTIKSSELRQRRLDRINAKAAKKGEAGPGRVVSFSDRSKSNALPGVDPETGKVVVGDIDPEVVDPGSFTKWRKANRFTLNDIADRFVVSPTTPKKWSICERAMPSPTIVKLACAAIDAGLPPAFNEADLTTIDEVTKLHSEYQDEYAVAEKRGRIALMSFIDRHDGDDHEVAAAKPGGQKWLPESTHRHTEQDPSFRYKDDMELLLVRDAALAEMAGDGAMADVDHDSQNTVLDLTFLSRKIAEAVDGLPVKDAEIAIQQILSGIPPVELRRSIRSRHRKTSSEK